MMRNETRFYPMGERKPALNFGGAWPKMAPCACGCGTEFMKRSWSAKLPECAARGKAASESKAKKKNRAATAALAAGRQSGINETS